MAEPHGYYNEEPYYHGDKCPECNYGVVIQCSNGELACNNCGLTFGICLDPNLNLNQMGFGVTIGGRIVPLDQYEPINIFSGQPEGTAGTPAMNLKGTKEGRIAGAVWLEKHSKKKRQ